MQHACSPKSNDFKICSILPYIFEQLYPKNVDLCYSLHRLWPVWNRHIFCSLPLHVVHSNSSHKSKEKYLSNLINFVSAIGIIHEATYYLHCSILSHTLIFTWTVCLISLYLSVLFLFVSPASTYISMLHAGKWKQLHPSSVNKANSREAWATVGSWLHFWKQCSGPSTTHLN